MVAVELDDSALLRRVSIAVGLAKSAQLAKRFDMASRLLEFAEPDHHSCFVVSHCMSLTFG
jgi:hypothetical protein